VAREAAHHVGVALHASQGLGLIADSIGRDDEGVRAEPLRDRAVDVEPLEPIGVRDRRDDFAAVRPEAHLRERARVDEDVRPVPSLSSSSSSRPARISVAVIPMLRPLSARPFTSPGLFTPLQKCRSSSLNGHASSGSRASSESGI
jgi:hypothetical protein